MRQPTDHHGADGLGDIEQAMRSSAEQFPGVLPRGSTLDAIVGRGRRARSLGQAARLGVAGSLLAGVAFAAPAFLERQPSEPTVLNHVDESVEREQAVDANPVVRVLSPRDGAVVTTSRVSFSGEVTVGSTLRVGPYDVQVAPDGRWRIDLELETGTQSFTFWATDRAGRRGFDTVSITRAEATAAPSADASEADEAKVEDDAPVTADRPKEPAPAAAPVKAEPKAEPKPDPKPEPKPEPKPATTVAFTSSQKYGSCEEPVPYDEFEGTAQPGTQVWVWSEYGERKVTADGNGHWFAKVEFPDAPSGKTFDVKTKSLHTDEKIWFTFVNQNGHTDQAPNDVAFSANMENNHVEYDPPYGYWSGTAKPGTTIHVGSDHGGAKTTAGDDGTWRTKVWFEQAPYGTHTWTVVVESSLGDRATFEYTGTRPGAEPEPVNFTSDQVNDTTDDPTPHAQYVGTAGPGDKIWVFSDYGEGFTYADDSGNWALGVEFPDAPRGKSFTVKVKHWDTGTIHPYTLHVV